MTLPRRFLLHLRPLVCVGCVRTHTKLGCTLCIQNFQAFRVNETLKCSGL